MKQSKIIRATPEQIELYKKIWEHFGSQYDTAKALGVTQAAVSQYSQGRMAMSAHVAIRAERSTGGLFKAEELCPRLAEGFEPAAA